ncbi:hypothetical protein CLOM_g13042 [Closterium sp. NIES-68]|nr:hypothetical protein CLOM_g13042 [Closterium sp. NIES-68]GJP84488.1 hypothetical protein CLOP_g14551 [Closterium sp. NIES-67]
MAASSGVPFNPFDGAIQVNAASPLSGALRCRPPAALACSLSHGLSLSLLSSLTATWQHGRHRLRASTLDAAQPLDEASWKKAQSRPLLERFPLKAAVTASGLALTGDTLAQLVERYQRTRAAPSRLEAAAEKHLWQHDFIRGLRMASYGFLLYGPGCHAWYQWLDRLLPAPTLTNFSLKVLANQVVVGPTVLLVVFAWNMAWMGKARDIPDKYRRDFFPSLVQGYKFWVPATCLNFAVVPLEARVAFMSCCAIFWNFHLSSSLGKEAARPTPIVPPAPAPAPAATVGVATAVTAAGYHMLPSPSV